MNKEHSLRLESEKKLLEEYRRKVGAETKKM